MSDYISRQAAIDALSEEPEVWTGKDEYAQGLNNQWHYDVNALKKVPSAHPERKTGKWMVDPDGRLHCSACLENPTNRVIIDGKLVYDMTPIVGKMKYCPNCGAKMDGEE